MAERLITVTGIPETCAMLDALPKEIVLQGFLRALNAAATVMKKELYVQTPIKTNESDVQGPAGAKKGGLLTQGELKSAVMAEINIDSRGRGGTADIGFGTTNKRDLVAMWVEFGHRLVVNRGKNKGKQIKFVPGKGFMRRATDYAGEAAIDAFTKSLEATVAANYQSTPAAGKVA